MKKILGLLLAASTSVVIAESANLYVGVAAGAAWNDQVAPATSFRLNGGYNFTDNWAFEIGTTGVTQSGQGTNQNLQYYDASVKGTLPFGDIFSGFLQAGGAYGSASFLGSPDALTGTLPVGVFQSGWNFMSGAGIQANITRQFSVNLTDIYYYGAPNPNGNTNVLLLGAKYAF
jgi:hypothetical protein